LLSIDEYFSVCSLLESPKGTNRVVVRLERVECQLPNTDSPSKAKQSAK